MARQLVTYVHIGGEVYGPGAAVPPEVAKKITNPAVWAPEPAPERAPEPAPAPAEPRRSRGGGKSS